MSEALNRCRLMLVADADAVTPEAVADALEGGDVASVILYSAEVDAPQFESFCIAVVPLVQSKEIAAIVTDNSQVMGRSDADGILAVREKPQLGDLVARFSPHNIVGCGNVKDRHGALQVGELKPDFLFFGRLGGDIRPEPHRKNLALAEWWAEMVQVSAIVMGGNSLESIVDCAETGVEFAGLSKAVFEHEAGPKAAVEKANTLLDAHAPIFEDEA